MDVIKFDLDATCSANLSEFSTALSKFQGEIKDVFKNKEGAIGGRTYKYADLCALFELFRSPLSSNGLSVSQHVVNHPDKEDYVYLHTFVLHSSGQFIKSTCGSRIDVKLNNNNKPILSFAQSAGLVITYLRRYALLSILGISQTDDDASLEPVISDEMYTILMSLITATNSDVEGIETWLKKFAIPKLNLITQKPALKLMEILIGRIGNVSDIDLETNG